MVSLRRVDVEETLSSHPHIISAIRERAETLFNKDSAEIAKRKAGGDASGGAGSAAATPRESSERESPLEGIEERTRSWLPCHRVPPR